MSFAVSCIIELYEKEYNVADFFPNSDFLPGFRQKISEATMGGDIIFFVSEFQWKVTLGPFLVFFVGFSHTVCY